MSTSNARRHLPPEILDHIVNLLHDDTETLNRCCLVSKTWIQRARRLLFAQITFQGNRLKLWKKTFPDPKTSPAYHTRTLTIDVDVIDVEKGDWIQGFSRVERLSACNIFISFALLCKLSPSLKSLHLSLSFLHPHVFDLICSLPHLEDLTLISDDLACDDDELDGPLPLVPSSVSPPLTGSLRLSLGQGIASTARRLLDLPNGLHFREVRLSTHEVGDTPVLAELVEACSDTLECLYIGFGAIPEPASSPIDLSKATKLRDAAFRCYSLRVGWIAKALETITPQHRDLQHISIRLATLFGYVFSSATESQIQTARPGTQWSDLERLLVQLCESHSTRVTIVYPRLGYQAVNGVRGVREWLPYLFPELSERGIVDIVEELDTFDL